MFQQIQPGLQDNRNQKHNELTLLHVHHAINTSLACFAGALLIQKEYVNKGKNLQGVFQKMALYFTSLPGSEMCNPKN
ncbi:hypothetical protein T4B_12884 [Trichinella pseudospiralis]|uniref:Uncharacterized protein n=1 Tax=Trichinella pseudospiralis TaxID=6337 RepID=A0A0V1IFE2_TRIPS|nr:hypothetical protein T4B_12884 [Trichinella pseudospiralis]